MSRHNRICVKDAIHHCYQRTKDGFIIFYSVSDYLVFFTLLCTVAPRYSIRIVAIAIMLDHIHLSVIAPSWLDLWRFMQQLQSMFVKEHNATCHRKGSFFRSPFGSAPKASDKQVRTNIAYVANNPVERHLAQYAEEYRWTFLAYAVSNHPFSKAITKRKSSKELKQAVSNVDSTHASGTHLRYSVLQKMFGRLSKEECNQLTDYIIAKYSIIDYQTAISFYGSYEKMITAIHSNTGSEYEIKERNTGKRDDVYSKITSILMNTGRFKDIHDVLSLNAEKKIELFSYLLGKTEATPHQIAKYLRVVITTQ